jgi:hypothetical protein
VLGDSPKFIASMWRRKPKGIRKPTDAAISLAME